MGSDSDWPTMKAAAEALDELGIDSTAEVVSAHRMPEDMVEWAKTAADRGLRVIIAGAGGAAHLPGMIASMTSLPVIGVPVPLKYLDGMDSLLSIVQMPGGVPVATVSIGGAKNEACWRPASSAPATPTPRRRSGTVSMNIGSPSGRSLSNKGRLCGDNRTT